MQFQLRMYVVLCKDVHFEVLCVFSCFLLEGHAKPAENACLSAEDARVSTQLHEKPTEIACRSVERRAKPAENQLKMQERRVVL